MVSSLLLGCSAAAPQESKDKQLAGQIFLLGEYHNLEAYYQKEFEIWSAYYNEYGMRDLFIELPCYMAGYLNLWMQSDHDDFLKMYFSGDDDADLKGPRIDFYYHIKAECPETVFHGTDVGHEFAVGESFLEYLTSTGQSDTEMYRLTQECMEQGRIFYGDMQDIHDEDWAYREDRMVENFIREMENTNGTGVMGIYGCFHTDVTAMNYDSQEVPSMAGQLLEKYGDALHTRDLTFGFRTDDPYTGGRSRESALNRSPSEKRHIRRGIWEKRSWGKNSPNISAGNSGSWRTHMRISGISPRTRTTCCSAIIIRRKYRADRYSSLITPEPTGPSKGYSIGRKSDIL